MQKVIKVYKNLSETPLEALERVRSEAGIGQGVPMTYAGRLDPMAEGEMIILVGEECKNKESYSDLPKTYEFEILSGFSTDTYDILGLITETNQDRDIDVKGIEKYLESFKKKFNQSYPPYSSKTFLGKQLHTHAREGNTPEVSHEVELFDFEFLGEKKIETNEMLKIITERIVLVKGNFRQKEIIEKWNEILNSAPFTHFRDRDEMSRVQITKWRVKVSSGFYIRQLVHDISKHFGVPATTFHIKRTQIGK